MTSSSESGSDAVKDHVAVLEVYDVVLKSEAIARPTWPHRVQCWFTICKKAKNFWHGENYYGGWAFRWWNKLCTAVA